MDATTLRLRALEGAPLEDDRIRVMVLATARALAERSGVGVRELVSDSTSVTLTLELDQIAAIGFVAELRRVTNAWYQGKFDAGPLWVAHDEDPRWE